MKDTHLLMHDALHFFEIMRCPEYGVLRRYLDAVQKYAKTSAHYVSGPISYLKP